MQSGLSGEGGLLLSLSVPLFLQLPLSISLSLSLSPLTPRGAAGGSGCSGSGRRASPAASGSFQGACSPRSGLFGGIPATRTACERPIWQPLCRGLQRRSCCARQTPEHDDPVPLRCLCRGSASPPTCVAARPCCHPHGPVPPRCPPHVRRALPPRNRSLTENKRKKFDII